MLKTSALELDRLIAALTLDGGRLALKAGSGLAGGSLDARIDLRAAASPATLAVNIDGEGIILGRLPHAAGEAWFEGGATSLQVEGSGTGESIGEMMDDWDGKFLVRVGEMTVPNNRVEFFGADLLTTVFSGLNPFSGQEETAVVECAVINLGIEDGIAAIDRQIAVQTTKMSVVGSGTIDLGTEELNLGIRPYARQGLGLNVNDFAGFAGIGGTLANPQVRVDGGAALKSGVTAGAAIATGGLSLLGQALFNKTTSDPDPCLTALGGAPVSEKSVEADTREAPPAEQGGGILDNVKSGFRRLIGR